MVDFEFSNWGSKLILGHFNFQFSLLSFDWFSKKFVRGAGIVPGSGPSLRSILRYFVLRNEVYRIYHAVGPEARRIFNVGSDLIWTISIFNCHGRFSIFDFRFHTRFRSTSKEIWQWMSKMSRMSKMANMSIVWNQAPQCVNLYTLTNKPYLNSILFKDICRWICFSCRLYIKTVSFPLSDTFYSGWSYW